MPEDQSPAGTPEYLEHGSGGPIPPQPPAQADVAKERRGHRAWWIGGGVIALLGVGAGAWAALSFFQQGAQPAEALPSTTVGYVSIDLDPSGGQKIDAFRTLNKFPAYKDDVGVNSVDDIRRKVGESMLSDVNCPQLSYDRDIAPWLGERAAAAAVPVDGGKPQLVIVVQVTDEAKARDAFTSLNACDGQENQVGFVVHDGWAVLAQSQKTAEDVSDATKDGSLADDATYQKWTKAVGDPGVVNAYASPEAGKALGQQLGGLLDGGMFSPSELGTAQPGTSSSSGYQSSLSVTGADEPLTDALSQFKGGAATVRFTGDGLEVSMAADGTSPQLKDFASATAGELVTRLPADTGAAVGVSLSPGWIDRRLGAVSSGLGGMSKEDLYREMSQETGLDVPADIDTLLGSGFALSVGKDLDPEAVENSADGSGIPVAATVKGDPAKIEAVLDKLRSRAGDLPFLGSDSSGDLEVVGPSEDYRKQVLKGGDLGDDDAFRSVVPDAGRAGSVIYVNVDAFEPALKKLASAGSEDDIANLVPLRAVGLSSWVDDGVTRFSFKVTTN